MKVRCPATSPALPADLKGRHFVALLGRGLHSSTYQLNMSRSCHEITP